MKNRKKVMNLKIELAQELGTCLNKFIKLKLKSLNEDNRDLVIIVNNAVLQFTAGTILNFAKNMFAENDRLKYVETIEKEIHELINEVRKKLTN